MQDVRFFIEFNVEPLLPPFKRDACLDWSMGFYLHNQHMLVLKTMYVGDLSAGNTRGTRLHGLVEAGTNPMV